MTRSYRSEIREAQSAETRERLVAHAADLLKEDGIEALTLPKLAARATVSVPTVYRYFATLEDLLRALLDWLRPQIGMTPESILRADVASAPHENFPRFEAHAAVLEPLMESRAWYRVRVASQTNRSERGAEVLRSHAPELSQAELEAAAGAIFVLGSPQAWRWFRDTWGVDTARAADAAAWAMRTLVAALPATKTIQPKPTRKAR